MKKVLLLALLCSLAISSHAQVTIQMQRQEGGTFLIPGKINGLNLNFIFDTGASNVCISATEAIFMLKNGYLNESDIKGVSYSQIANGDIVENTEIVLKKVEVGGIVLQNVSAVVAHNLNAPLLFGQSAIQKLGPIQLDGEKLIIKNGRNFKSDEEAEKMYMKGYQEVQSHKYNDAIDTSLKGISLTNNKIILVRLYAILAQAYSGLNDLERAIEACDMGLSLNPADEYMAYNRCVFLFDSGKLDMADEAFTMFIRTYQGNAKIPQHMMFGAYSYLGMIKSSKGQYPASEGLFLKAIANSPDPTSINMLSTYRGLADLYYIQDKFAEAIPYYIKATELVPDDISNIAFCFKLAVCYNFISDNDNAIKYYNKSLDLFVKYGDAIQGVIKDDVEEYIDDAQSYSYYGTMSILYLSQLYYINNDIDKAISGYKLIWNMESMQQYISSLDFAFFSESYFKKGDNVSANKIINEGLEKYPQNPDLLFIKAIHNKDNNIVNIGIYNEIIRQEKSYEPFRFDYATAYNNLAWAYCLIGEYNKALPYSLKSIQMDATHDYSWDTLGEIYYNLGRYSDSIDAMTKCIELTPNSKNAYLVRGNAKIQLGKKKDGEKDIKIANSL